MLKDRPDHGANNRTAIHLRIDPVALSRRVEPWMDLDRDRPPNKVGRTLVGYFSKLHIVVQPHSEYGQRHPNTLAIKQATLTFAETRVGSKIPKAHPDKTILSAERKNEL